MKTKKINQRVLAYHYDFFTNAIFIPFLSNFLSSRIMVDYNVLQSKGVFGRKENVLYKNK